MRGVEGTEWDRLGWEEEEEDDDEEEDEEEEWGEQVGWVQESGSRILELGLGQERRRGTNSKFISNLIENLYEDPDSHSGSTPL
ncbi:hypothetical protein llap_8157 [Limosa lapponica baueri]|uniref:Uncharacterized protein n=1 Tax=Limosa lapponica baueri TaxID=1758121 RepID=A0A2I0U6D4_LIMLA|nr:hypothetical protein llap_8157 [Limosa lapponica baueri]